jgi:serine/threonine-protein kinase
MNVGRYEVIEELGQGGMAIVYLARDPYIKRQVAVKVLPRQFTFDPEFRGRFQREAEVIATLEHSSIVPVYDFGEQEGQPFLVMRYMSGGTLADRLEKGPLPIPEIITVFERVGAAVDYANSKGVIHRDIKPGNILFDAQGGICLSDFGIAKIAEATAAFTGTGIIGTPAYMAPEQAQGEKLDGRSDIYSLGVVLFQALSGELPFKANTPMGVAVAHITEPVPSLLARRADLPRGFEEVIRKTLDKDPAKRYQTANQLAQAINEAAKSAADKTILEPVDSTLIEPVDGRVTELPQYQSTAQPQPAPAQGSYSSPMSPQPAARNFIFPRLLSVGGAGILALCVCIGLIGGFASGLIPNPFAVPPPSTLPATDLPVAQPETLEPSDTPVVTEVIPTIVVTPSATTIVEPTEEISTPTEAVLLPYFTAQTNMLCREGPSTDYVDRWQVLAGETVQVLAQWYQDSNWLLVDVDPPPTETRTDCCWVGGSGTLNVSLDQIETISFLPDRLDCSALK